jgi:hypothetical protein
MTTCSPSSMLSCFVALDGGHVATICSFFSGQGTLKHEQLGTR